MRLLCYIASMRAPVILHTAIHAEARPLIDWLDAKKRPAPGAIGLFSNDDTNVHIVVSGVGKLRTAAAIGFACERLSPANSRCYIVNIGIAGAADTSKIGSLCSVEKSIDRTTSHAYYPDMLLIAPGMPVTCETHDRPVLDSNLLVSAEHIADMEACAVFECGRIFSSSSTIQAFKVISDGLACSIPSLQAISDFIAAHCEAIGDYIERAQGSVISGAQILDETEMKQLDELARALQLTATQNASLFNYARFCKTRRGALPAQLSSSKFKCAANKQARNQMFAQIQNELNA